MKRRLDPLLRTQPWKIHAVFDPLDRVIARLEADGTVETDGRLITFYDAASNERLMQAHLVEAAPATDPYVR